MTRAGSAVRTLAHDPVLRRAAGAIAFFELAYYGPWVAMLVFAYAHGGAMTAGVVALAQLVPTALFAPVAGRRSRSLRSRGPVAACWRCPPGRRFNG